ncbi:unnamed protein product, partial [Sphacelaria rigidula]
QPLRAHPTNITASSRPFSSSGVENSTNRIVEGSSCNNSMGIAAGGRVSNSSVNALGGRATGNGAQRHAAADDIAGGKAAIARIGHTTATTPAGGHKPFAPRSPALATDAGARLIVGRVSAPPT